MAMRDVGTGEESTSEGESATHRLPTNVIPQERVQRARPVIPQERVQRARPVIPQERVQRASVGIYHPCAVARFGARWSASGNRVLGLRSFWSTTVAGSTAAVTAPSPRL